MLFSFFYSDVILQESNLDYPSPEDALFHVRLTLDLEKNIYKIVVFISYQKTYEIQKKCLQNCCFYIISEKHMKFKFLKLMAIFLDFFWRRMEQVQS